MHDAPKRTRPVLTPWTKQSLRHLLQETDTFITCVELVTSRGVITEHRVSRVLELARGLAEHPRIHGLSITDNPGGNASVSADTLGIDLISRGQEVIIHISCKDWNRNALQSQGWSMASKGFNNILALSGDYPIDGYEGLAGGVFDIDSVGLLKMLSDMNEGLEVNQNGKAAEVLERTRFFLGAVVNNYKMHEREVMPQYFKLAKKIETGAEFIINQIGYDSRKQDELIKYMKLHDLDVPLIGNVYVLSRPAARYFNSGRIPGVTVTDDLLKVAEEYGKSKDKGKAFFLEFAAKQCAIAKGLGYRGIYLGGQLGYKDYERILEIADGFGETDWKGFAKEIRYQLPGEFYYFEPDPETDLSSVEVSRKYLQSKDPEALRASRQKLPFSYKLNRIVHDAVFEKGSKGFGIGRRLSEAISNAGGRLEKVAHTIEQVVKLPAFDCRDCGDCSLPDIAFLCPESQCVKNQRNGPCGGTQQGKCEIGDKECIWARAYERLKACGKEQDMLDRPVIFKDGSLKGTSAWVNTFLERDHHSKEK